MLPIGPLMIEHRLIERVIPPIRKEIDKIEKTRKIDAQFIENVVDFFRVYADKTHHGKEEDILFRELAGKEISSDHRRIMDELMSEHKQARQAVGSLLEARVELPVSPEEAVRKALKSLKFIVKLYPEHIRKEDQDLFPPVMDYFTDAEKEAMLEEGRRYDETMIHDKYKNFIAGLEGRD